MRIVEVYLEHPVMELNNTFSYLLAGSDYCCRGMRVRVDFNGQKIIGFVDSVGEVEDVDALENKLGYTLKQIEGIIDEEPLLNDELYQLGLWLSYQTVSPVISCFQTMLPAALKPRSSFKKAVTVRWVKILDEKVKQEYEYDCLEMPLKDFKEKISQYRYNKLKENRQIEVYDKQKEAEVEPMEIHDPDYELTDLQKKALDQINKSAKDVILLHGLTGSGKTEIYMQLVKQVVLEGKQALVLVPEISLTPQMVARFRQRFANNIAIYHSGLNGQQKYEQYQLFKQNNVNNVIGTRSAVFMPFRQLGIIILDEEHDNSYKQDNKPKYNTRDVAVKRAQYHHCKVLLGSATPTLESYARGIKGVYELVTLNKRIGYSLPKSTLVDMNQEIRKGNYIISAPLKKAIGKRLEANQQVILLLNRRGYTPIMKCRNCGKTMMCPHCDVTLSYHKDEGRLICHCCGYSQPADIDCPDCGSHQWNNYGIGTQRLVEEVQRFYPQARIIRMDADTTRNKDSHRTILEQFGNHEYDILVGTQMISKGLDYPNVTLVGIFNADGPLNRTDYRSVETTFDLIVQASGRSGRGKQEGEVYIQVYDSSHYAVRFATSQNYIGFFNNEMQYRHAGKYPPYTFLIAVLFTSKDEEKSSQAAQDAVRYFRNDEEIRTLGPSKLIKRNDEYRYRLVLKGKNKEQLLEKLWTWYNRQSINKHAVSIMVDVDPYILD